MINITPKTLKLVAKELKKQLSTLSIKPSNETLLEIVFRSHKYTSFETIPNDKHDILNTITKNLMNALNSMNYNYSEEPKSQVMHRLVAHAYGWNPDEHPYRAKNKRSSFESMLEELKIGIIPPVLFHKHNTGYKEDNENWFKLPIIYIHILKPNKKTIELINIIDGVKFLSDTELRKFMQSYESVNNKWHKSIDKTKDTIIKLVNFRFDNSLKIGEDSLIEKINIEFDKFLPEGSDNHTLIVPIAYIIDNKYLNIPSLDDESFDYPSTAFWN